MIKTIALTVLPALTLVGGALAGEPWFMMFEVPEGYESAGVGEITDAGVGAAGLSTADTEYAARWSLQDGFTLLGDLPGGRVFSRARDISADGLTIVGISSSAASGAEGAQGFAWTADGGMQALPDLPGADVLGGPQGASSDGSVLAGTGEYNDGIGADHHEPARWVRNGGSYTVERMLPGQDGGAIDISGDGTKVVGYYQGGDPFLWIEGEGATQIGTGRGEAISQDGSTVVGVGGGAWRWTEEEGMQYLSEPGGLQATVPYDVSADGSIIIGAQTPTERAFIWTESEGVRDLQTVLEQDYGFEIGNWGYFAAGSISPSGNYITGGGWQGETSRAWIAYLPEPGTLALLLVGATLLTRRRRG